MAPHHAPLTPPRPQHQRRHRHRRLPAPVLDSLRCDGLGHASRPPRPHGQARHQERLSPLPSPPQRTPPPGHAVAGALLLRPSPPIRPPLSAVHIQRPSGGSRVARPRQGSRPHTPLPGRLLPGRGSLHRRVLPAPRHRHLPLRCPRYPPGRGEACRPHH